jgi:hypothetical protein
MYSIQAVKMREVLGVFECFFGGGAIRQSDNQMLFYLVFQYTIITTIERQWKQIVSGTPKPLFKNASATPLRITCKIETQN